MNAYGFAPLARSAAVGVAAAGAAWAVSWHARGSIALGDWMPAALLVVAVVVTVLASGAARRPPRAAAVSLAGLVGLAAWTALSLTWSALPSLARDEALLVVAYAAAFALPVLALAGGRDRLAAAGAVAAPAAALALATGAALAWGDAPERHFEIGRLEFPIGYANAQAAAFLLGAWPAVAVAASRTAPIVARAAGVGCAAAVLAGWLATQSKGGAVGIVASALVVFAVSPLRLRLAVPALLAAAAALAAVRPLTEPYRVEDEALRAASAGAGRALLVVALAAAAAGAAYALLDRRLTLTPRARRAAGVGAGVAVAAAAAVAIALALTTFGRPDRALADAWESFSTFHHGDARSHLVSLGGSNRYDFWRVALEGAAEHPLVGIGARGFGAEYLVEGRSFETPARTHSLPLELLLEEGLIGLALLGLALVPALAAAAATMRRGDLAAAGALGACVGWLAHASVDWIWTFAAVGIPFFVLLGIGVAGRRAGAPAPLLPRRGSAVAAAALAVGALALLVPPWLSARLVDRTYADPAAALAAARRAQALDPLAIRPVLLEAQLVGSPAEAVEVLREAERMEPRSVAVRYLLGLALLESGRREDAVRQLEVARELAPRDDLVAAALERARGG